MPERMIRWGVVGAGGFADKRAIPALRQIPQAQVQAVMVTDLQRARTLAEKHGTAEAYHTIKGLVSQESGLSLLQGALMLRHANSRRRLT